MNEYDSNRMADIVEKDKYLRRSLNSIDLNVQNQINLLENFNFKKELLDLNLDKGSNNFGFHFGNGSFEKGDAEIYYQMIKLKK